MRIAPGYYGMRVIDLRRALNGQPDNFVVTTEPDGLAVAREDGLTRDAFVSFVDDAVHGVDRAAAQADSDHHDHGGEG